MDSEVAKATDKSENALAAMFKKSPAASPGEGDSLHSSKWGALKQGLLKSLSPGAGKLITTFDIQNTTANSSSDPEVER